MTIVDTDRFSPDRDRLVAVCADPGRAWRTEPYERKLQYALRQVGSASVAARTSVPMPRLRVVPLTRARTR